ncbi:MAG: triacylglycerol lipase [Sandaracinus sp.]|nr:triacylglycerol lipase [Sandaracinus sp.]
MAAHQVVLIPGFFGFEALGELRYFAGVARTLESALKARGLDADVVELPTLPTASIRHRAASVLDRVGALVARTTGPLHLIGHSTGGLDARLALAPTASLPSEQAQKAIFERVQTVVTVSTPHLGTPLASFFASAAGKPLLRVFALTMGALLQERRLPLNIALGLGRLLTRADDLLGLRNTTVDELYRGLLSDFGSERREAIAEMLEQIASDQSLIFQLTPAAVDLFNSATADPEGVRYGSVVTRARSPGLASMRDIGRDVYAQGLHGLFAGLYALSGRHVETPLLPAHQEALERIYGEVPPVRANDGIVPTRSQVWGEVITGTMGDHLDLVGHYRTEREGFSSDWLPSSSGFDDEDFDRVWGEVARFIAEDRVVDRQDPAVRGLPANDAAAEKQ